MVCLPWNGFNPVRPSFGESAHCSPGLVERGRSKQMYLNGLSRISFLELKRL
jgi:hypothetical protein